MTRGRTRPQRISLLLADVDGTLVTHDKVLTPRAIAAVDALAAHDIRFALTSGRPPRGMAMLVEPLRLTTPIAGFNGGVYANPDMSVLSTNTLPPEVSRRAASLILDQGLDLWVYTADQWLVRDPQGPHVAREQWTVKFPPQIVHAFDEALDRAVKLVGISDDHDRVARAEAAAQRELGDAASAARSQPYYLDITHPRANKGDVVTFLAGTFGISTDEIATIGDMPNDTLMFRRSGLAIAMGQSAAEVQNEADVVTASSEDDGFAKAVEDYILAHATGGARAGEIA